MITGGKLFQEIDGYSRLAAGSMKSANLYLLLIVYAAWSALYEQIPHIGPLYETFLCIVFYYTTALFAPNAILLSKTTY